MFRKKIFRDNTYWIHLTLVRNQMQTAVNKINTRVLQNIRYFLSSQVTVQISSSILFHGFN